MPTLTTPTPTGDLIITSNGAAITQVAWVEDESDAVPDNPDALCRQAAAELASYFANGLKTFTVPIALSGSALQLGVWEEMLKIPFGSVATYGDVAHAIGSEPQAVGAACGQNRIPVLVPCHRVVGAGGKLVGFSGGQGVATKAFLLDHECGQARLL